MFPVSYYVNSKSNNLVVGLKLLDILEHNVDYEFIT